MTTGRSGVAELNSYFNNIYEDAVFVVREQNLMTRLVRTYTNGRGDQTRTLTTYNEITPSTVAETEDYSNPTAFEKSLVSTLTPAEVMSQVLLTDRRIETDPQNARDDAARELGMGHATALDENLASNFASFTAGTVGASGSTMIWGYFYAAHSILRANKVPGPYVCVMHPYHWHDLAGDVAGGATATNAPDFQDQVMRDWFVRRVAGVDIFVSANVSTSGSDAYSGMFSRDAIAFDLRRDFRLEPERDASARAWELNATMLYAHGVWRPAFGVTILADATTPAS